jgi:hypothetical protein
MHLFGRRGDLNVWFNDVDSANMVRDTSESYACRRNSVVVVIVNQFSMGTAVKANRKFNVRALIPSCLVELYCYTVFVVVTIYFYVVSNVTATEDTVSAFVYVV